MAECILSTMISGGKKFYTGTVTITNNVNKEFVTNIGMKTTVSSVTVSGLNLGFTPTCAILYGANYINNGWTKMTTTVLPVSVEYSSFCHRISAYGTDYSGASGGAVYQLGGDASLTSDGFVLPIYQAWATTQTFNYILFE